MSSPITSAPAAASAAQTACPIPRAAPVTRADLPSRLKFTCGTLSPMSYDEPAAFIFYRKDMPVSARRGSSRHLAPGDEWHRDVDIILGEPQLPSYRSLLWLWFVAVLVSSGCLTHLIVFRFA